MAGKVFLNPDVFQAEVDAFKSAIEGVSGVQLDNISEVGNKTILESMDTMIATINFFSEMMEYYVSFSNEDAQHLVSLKTSWVTKDTQLGEEIGGD